MASRKVLIPLLRDEVHPRFDLAVEVMLAELTEDGGQRQRILVLPHASADELCDLILREGVGTVVCGGLEEEYYHYLRWKRVEVIDGVAGEAALALERYKAGALRSGDILFTRSEA